jgi:hypothetical protein
VTSQPRVNRPRYKVIRNNGRYEWYRFCALVGYSYALLDSIRDQWWLSTIVAGAVLLLLIHAAANDRAERR